MKITLPLLEGEIFKSRVVYGNTVMLEISDLVDRKIATPKEIVAWIVGRENLAWLEGASDPVIRNVYHGRLHKLAIYNNRLFTRLFVDRDQEYS